MMENMPGNGDYATQWKGTCLFVQFDFEFFPMRVHSGQGSINWQGHEWQGIGDVLRKDASSRQTMHSARSNVRGSMSASLPMDKEMLEILTEEYYRDREMQWMICAINANGGVERRVCVNRGRITEYRRMEDCVTFTAQCDFFDSLNKRDSRHKSRVAAIRQRFKWGLADAIVSNGIGWMVSLAEMFAGTIGLAIDVQEALVPGRNRRIAKHRWAARERTYWFNTEPRIPGRILRRKGYKIRADTLDEAKCKLYELVAGKIWDIPQGFINMVIYLDGRPLGFLNLDELRANDDLRRYEETIAMRGWPP